MRSASSSLSSSSQAQRAISVQELFAIGIGPSSSHTVGPMKAAHAFAVGHVRDDFLPIKVTCTLYGSLALTGIGHATDKAILLGLSGYLPDAIDQTIVKDTVSKIETTGQLKFAGVIDVPFTPSTHLIFVKKALADHPNGIDFEITYDNGDMRQDRYFSIGGGAIVRAGESAASQNITLPFPFSSAAELLAQCEANRIDIADLVRANETAWRSAEDSDSFVDNIRTAMLDSIEAGCISAESILPGGLNVKRRARAMRDQINEGGLGNCLSKMFEWVSLWALAVNEENAAGGRIVTAPTNGAAGVLPAVIKYYETFKPGATPQGSRKLLYTAAGIGFLYKKRASISAAEMGCQGEVGVACSMAAAGLAAAMGGSVAQVENAAEIGMEHNLGLTCDPIGGLVQIPCIERNTMGAIKAINAAHLALAGDGSHVVSLDAVIETMRQTGEDMKSKYKETSLGGLAVNFVEC